MSAAGGFAPLAAVWSQGWPAAALARRGLVAAWREKSRQRDQWQQNRIVQEGRFA